MKITIASDESLDLLRAQISLRKAYEERQHENSWMLDEILRMIEFIDEVRCSWQEDEEESARLKLINENLKRENRNLNDELCIMHDKCREADVQVSALTFSTNSLRCEIEEYRRKFDEIKSILRDGNGDATQMEQISSYFSCEENVSSDGSCSSISYDSQTNDEADYDDGIDNPVDEWQRSAPPMRRFASHSAINFAATSGSNGIFNRPVKMRPTYTRLLADNPPMTPVKELCDEIDSVLHVDSEMND